MTTILTFTGAVARDPAIERWLAFKPAELAALARHWFGVMRGCGDDVLELFHDEAANACVRDAPFAYVAVFKTHVNVGFFRGSSLPDPAKLLEGSGTRMRHVKLRLADGSVEADALENLILAAYRDIRSVQG